MSSPEAPGALPTAAWCPTCHSPRCERPAVMVLFGATGDLTARKLLPAVYSLTADGLLPCGLPIVCVGRRAPDRETLLQQLRAGVERFARRRPVEEALWREIAARIHYVRGGLEEATTYQALGEVLAWAGSECAPSLGRLFYLATPPEYFPGLVTNLKEHGLAGDAAEGPDWARIVIEKPFGRDAESARALNALVRERYAEDQIYRMDHYLGKETVQNLVVLRFANSIFEPVWSGKYIHHVEITVAETAGIEGRGGYFDATGIVRDVVQNHVLQMLALVAMEPPASMAPSALRDEKLKVLRALRPMAPEEIDRSTVRGRYARGTVENAEAAGYLEEPHVVPDSRTETYAALRVYLDDPRWAGVPFYLRAGKRLARRVTEVVVSFRDAPRELFPVGELPRERNRLVLRIQPDEGAGLAILAKQPGPGLEIAPVSLDFRYAEAFMPEPPEAYERLVLDATLGDHTLFAEGDSVEAAWDFVTPILRRWESRREPPADYPAGSWGPEAADRLLAETGDRWHQPGERLRESV